MICYHNSTSCVFYIILGLHKENTTFSILVKCYKSYQQFNSYIGFWVIPLNISFTILRLKFLHDIINAIIVSHYFTFFRYFYAHLQKPLMLDLLVDSYTNKCLNPELGVDIIYHVHKQTILAEEYLCLFFCL